MGGAVTTGVEAVGEDVVRVEVVVLPAIFHADVEVEAAIGGRQPDAVLAEVAGGRRIEDIFFDRRRPGGRYRYIGELLCRRRRTSGRGGTAVAGRPDVPRHAIGVRAVHARRADRRAHRDAGDDRLTVRLGRVGNHVQRVGDLRITEEVALDVPEIYESGLSVSVVSPYVVDRALEAQDLPESVRAVVVEASATLDVAPGDPDLDIIARRETERGVIRSDVGRRADRRDFLRGQQRIVALDDGFVDEGKRAARTVLRLIGVARVHGFAVEGRVLAHVEVQEPASGPAVVLALEVAERAVVVQVCRPLKRPETAGGGIDRVIEKRRRRSGDHP